MKLATFYKQSTAYYISGKCKYLRSAPGRGKTATITACVPKIARDLNKRLGFTMMSGPLLNPADTIGYLVPRHNDDGTVESLYTRPFWWRTEEGKYLEEYEGGIVFIDEVDKADVDVKKILGEMAYSGKCGPHRLPPGWVVWMAGNRQGDRSGSTKELDHLINRRFEIDVTDDIKGWEEWALKNNVHPTIVAFAVQNPQIVFSDELPKEQGPWCTPRSLVATGELLATLATLAGNEHGLPDDDDAVEIAAAGIGKAAAAQLFATIQLEGELPKYDAIIKDPAGAKLPANPGAQMLGCYQLASRVEAATLPAVIQYVERMPADFAATFAKAACTRVRMFAAHPAMMDWTKRNNSLMTTLNMFK